LSESYSKILAGTVAGGWQFYQEIYHSYHIKMTHLSSIHSKVLE
jgi:hypothetical protein